MENGYGLATCVLARALEHGISRLEEGRISRFASGALKRVLKNLGSDEPPQSLPGPLVEAIQDIRLRRTVARVAERSPFYRARFAEQGLRAADIRGVRDIGRLPLITSADLAEAEQFLCVPWDEVSRVFTTSGTSREPKRVYRTARDFRRMVNLPALALRFQRLADRMVCLIAHAPGMFGLVESAQAMLELAGGLALPVGQPPPAEALADMLRYRVNAVMTSPSYLAALTRHAERSGVCLPLSIVFLDGEILTPDQSRHFAEFWGARVYNGYGLTEFGGLAVGLPGCDALHVNRLTVVAEVLDPITCKPAAAGELVLTSLTHEGMPLLRYRTGDRVRWVRCRCGWKAPAIHIYGRFGDSLVVAATNLHGQLIAEEIAQLDGVTGSLEVVVDHHECVDRLSLRVGVQPGQRLCQDAVAQRLFGLYPALANDQRAQAFELRIEFVENLRFSPKPLRVRDLRQ